jgi:pimeloyl-ACP methyl ester carboxylesterase
METVIVAHGLWMPGFETLPLRWRLRSAGFAAVLFRFPTVRGTLAENVARLARFADLQSGTVIHYVGHSLGGVVATALLEESPPARSGRIVCLGSPLNGSQVGRYLSRQRYGAAIAGRSVADLNACGGLPPWPGPTELGVIAGSLAFGAGRLFGPLPGPSDGTVAVSETRLENATDHLVLPVTHTSMLFDRTVARQTIAFLRRGRFVHSSSSATSE